MKTLDIIPVWDGGLKRYQREEISIVSPKPWIQWEDMMTPKKMKILYYCLWLLLLGSLACASPLYFRALQDIMSHNVLRLFTGISVFGLAPFTFVAVLLMLRAESSNVLGKRRMLTLALSSFIVLCASTGYVVVYTMIFLGF